MATGTSLKECIKQGIGGVLILLMPRRAARISRTAFPFNTAGEGGPLDRLIRSGLVRKHLKAGDLDVLSQQHTQFWSSRSASEFLEADHERFKKEFLPVGAAIMDRLETVLSEHPEVHTLCEIGTGRGQLLQYAADRFPSLKHFIGLDLSDQQVALNEQRNEDPRISFVTANALDWVPQQAEKGWLFLTNDGVLEYFTRDALCGLLDYIGSSLRPALFVAIEPLAEDYDLDLEQESRPYGFELSFCHNYPRHFRAAGFEILHEQSVTIHGARMLALTCAAGD